MTPFNVDDELVVRGRSQHDRPNGGLVTLSLHRTLASVALLATLVTPAEAPAEVDQRLTAEQKQEAAEQRPGRDALSLYQANCANCHDNCTAGAPAPHIQEEWSVRLANGLEDIYLNVLDGVGPQMPPRGLCYDCTDAELRAIVEFMVPRPE